jgi:hypothetical protein
MVVGNELALATALASPAKKYYCRRRLPPKPEVDHRLIAAIDVLLVKNEQCRRLNAVVALKDQEESP